MPPKPLVGVYKMGSGQPSMTWSECVDGVLWHGWIDGVRRRCDRQLHFAFHTPAGDQTGGAP